MFLRLFVNAETICWEASFSHLLDFSQSGNQGLDLGIESLWSMAGKCMNVDHFLLQCISNMHSGISKACQVLCGHKKTDNISFVWECSLIFIHTHFPIFVYAHSIIHNPFYLIGNSVGETPHTQIWFCLIVDGERLWWMQKSENASLKWWNNEDGSLLYMIGSKAHLLCSKMPLHSSHPYWNSCKQCKK